MDREAWQVTVHRVARVKHDLASKQQQQHMAQKGKALLPTRKYG